MSIESHRFLFHLYSYSRVCCIAIGAMLTNGFDPNLLKKPYIEFVPYRLLVIIGI